MIAFLIDADNFSSAEWVHEAFHTIDGTEGPIAIRRAYGSPENLKGLSDVFRTWAVRPFVNLPLAKNTTDISLAIDAMELACVLPKPKLVVIGSGDLDFLPLVVRLRERGIKVFCVTERSKMAHDAIPAYDKVLYVGADQPVLQKAREVELTIATPIRAPVRKVASKVATVKPTTTKEQPATKKVTSKKAAVKKAPSVSPETPTVQRILSAVPNLKAGQWQPLGEVAKLLHDQKLLAKNATSTKLFKKFPEAFELSPAGKPNKVRFQTP